MSKGTASSTEGDAMEEEDLRRKQMCYSRRPVRACEGAYFDKKAASVKTAEVMKRVCAAATASLKVREEELQTKDMGCEVLRLNWPNRRSFVQREELRTEGLWRKIATMKTKSMDLRGKIEARTDSHNKEMQRANELMAEQTKKHKAEFASRAKRLTDCEAAKSLKVKYRVKLM
ncbi:hypothetical protein AXG93_496s1000 [Marchantia polymorpha subsp. ruderalis]|uniref:Uncharacterized protein n=1 Tax=Marchantia polymorpha subsp. ruderalis TaxID=1480154 RepID=A0A176VRY7_MARPO|nr:hypothetical protein AXG93_496s1000 [Marchantia polymorpha subsp. ruderalis]